MSAVVVDACRLCLVQSIKEVKGVGVREGSRRGVREGSRRGVRGCGVLGRVWYRVGAVESVKIWMMENEHGKLQG